MCDTMLRYLNLYCYCGIRFMHIICLNLCEKHNVTLICDGVRIITDSTLKSGLLIKDCDNGLWITITSHLHDYAKTGHLKLQLQVQGQFYIFHHLSMHGMLLHVAAVCALQCIHFQQNCKPYSPKGAPYWPRLGAVCTMYPHMQPRARGAEGGHGNLSSKLESV